MHSRHTCLFEMHVCLDFVFSINHQIFGMMKPSNQSNKVPPDRIPSKKAPSDDVCFYYSKHLKLKSDSIVVFVLADPKASRLSIKFVKKAPFKRTNSADVTTFLQ